jgi:hypothetical protein
MSSIDEIRFRNSWEARSRPSHGVTLVALYGAEKPAAFTHLLDLVSEALKAEPVDAGNGGLAEWLSFYDRTQVHATIIGLEGKPESSGNVLNLNLAARFSGFLGADLVPTVDLEGLSQFLRDVPWFLEIQVGGFSETDKNPYDLARSPFARAFEVQSNGLIVMIGWPVGSSGKPSPALLGMRKYCERFHVVHKWQIAPHHQDNDLFFVLGSVSYERWSGATEGQRKAVQSALDQVTNKLRHDLAHNPFLFPITPADIWLIEYFSTTLEKVGLCTQLSRLTPEKLRAAYHS